MSAAAMGALSGRAGVAALTLSYMAAAAAADVGTADPRLREVQYDPGAVVSLPVKRGVVTLVVLDAGEAILEVAAGQGSDCSKPEAPWCVATQPGGRTLFIKPKSGAQGANNLAVVTDKRTHSLRLVLLADADPKLPVYRLQIKAPSLRPPLARSAGAVPGLALPLAAALLPPVELPSQPSLQAQVEERLQAKPEVLNTHYTLAEGKGSQDILPTLVFDDGRFTYLRFPGNREVPAVFHVLGDGSETLVNSRMEDDLLVVDRVSRRLMLRAGSAVVGLWNEAFDIEGRPPAGATTVPALQRVLKPAPGLAARRAQAGEADHD